MLLLGLSGSVWATDILLVPEKNPAPAYPAGLARSGIMGDVRLGFMVDADGGVRDIVIHASDHPGFAEAARETVSQWRFRPWQVDDEHPAHVQVVAPFVFRLDDLPLDINQRIKTWRCSDINAHANGQGWYLDLVPFRYTRGYLSRALLAGQTPDPERLAMIARFNRLIPRIVQRCGSFPATRYMKMLPQEIRQLL